MKALLIKDFYKQKKNILFMLVFYMLVNVGLILFRKEYENPYFSPNHNFIFIFTMLILQDLLRIEKDMAYSLSMPVSREDYVNAKLLFAFCIIVLLTCGEILSLFVVRLITGVSMLGFDLLYDIFLYGLFAYFVANMGLYFSFFADWAGFYLATILVLIGLLLSITILDINILDIEFLKSINKYMLTTVLLVYVLINEIIRRSSIRKIQEKRY